MRYLGFPRRTLDTYTASRVWLTAKQLLLPARRKSVKNQNVRIGRAANAAVDASKIKISYFLLIYFLPGEYCFFLLLVLWAYISGHVAFSFEF